MTRPSWKSPAVRKGKRSQVDLDRLSLIDVSMEDDSLLPSANKEPQGSFHDLLDSASDTGNLVKTLAVVQENVAESEIALPRAELGKQTDMQPTISTQEPALKSKRKKKGHFNLRKSLAWNNAFFTDEGVLDPEELSVVNKTFRKPPDLPRPNNRKTPIRSAKPLEPTLIPKIKISPMRPVKSAMVIDTRRIQTNSLQCQGSGLNLCSPRSSTGSITGSLSDKSEQRVNKGLVATRHVVGLPSSRMQAEPVKQVKPMFAARSDFSESKPVLSNKAIDSNPRKGGVQQHVSGGVSGIKSTSVMTKDLGGFSKTVSSVSKKMKDKFGMVLTGSRSGFQKKPAGIAEEDSRLSAGSPSASYLNSSEPAKVTRCYSHSPFERFERSTVTSSLESVSSNVFPLCPEPISTESSSSENMVDRKFTFSMPPAGEHLSCQHSALKSHANMEVKIPLSRGTAFVEPASSVPFFQSQQGSSSSPIFQGTVLAKNVSSSSHKSTDSGGGSGHLPHRARPSGLRMPSPKLGFFDTARGTPTPQATVLRERTSCLGRDGSIGQSGRNILPTRLPTEGGGTANNSQQSSGLKRPGFLAKPRQPLSEASGHQIRGISIPSGIPSAPHLRGTESSSWSLPSSTLAHSSPRFSNSSSNKIVSNICSRGQIVQPEKNVQHRILEEMAHTSSFLVREGNSNGPNELPISLEKKRNNFHFNTTFGAQVLSSITVDETGGHQAAHRRNPESVKTLSLSSPAEKAACDVGLDDVGYSGYPSNDILDTTVASMVLLSRTQHVDNHNNLVQNERPIEENRSQCVDTTGHILACASVSSSKIPKQEINKAYSILEEASSPVLHSKVVEFVNASLPSPGTKAAGTSPSSTRVPETYGLLSPKPGTKLSQNDKKHNRGSPVLTPKDADRSSLRSPFTVNSVNILNHQGSDNQFKKEKTSIFAFAKRIVSQLTLSPSGDGSEQENALPECQQYGEYQNYLTDQGHLANGDSEGFDSTSLSPISEGTSSLEHAGQEWPDEQSGAVQHSPPDKIPPQPGPWSPVRKTGQQIGPFDCTKCTTITGLPQ